MFLPGANEVQLPKGTQELMPSKQGHPALEVMGTVSASSTRISLTFMHPIQPIFVQHLVWARHSAEHWDSKVKTE